MKKIVLACFSLSVLAGCSNISIPTLQTPQWLRGDRSEPVAADPTADALPPPDAVEVAPLTDDTTAGAVRPPATTGGVLGTTVATLGDATKPGFWLETPLVSSPAQGLVRNPKNGREVKVDLIPVPGAATGGSFMSLGAMRLLDLPLTGLNEVEVSAG